MSRDIAKCVRCGSLSADGTEARNDRRAQGRPGRRAPPGTSGARLPRGARAAQAQAGPQAHPGVDPKPSSSKIDASSTTPIRSKRLQLIQDRIDLEAELEAMREQARPRAASRPTSSRGQGLQRAQGHLLRRLARARRRGRRAQEGRHQAAAAEPLAAGPDQARDAGRDVEQRPQQRHAVGRAEQRVAGPLGVGHQARPRCGPRCRRRRCRRPIRWGCRRSGRTTRSSACSMANVSASQV